MKYGKIIILDCKLIKLIYLEIFQDKFHLFKLKMTN